MFFSLLMVGVASSFPAIKANRARKMDLHIRSENQEVSPEVVILRITM